MTQTAGNSNKNSYKKSNCNNQVSNSKRTVWLDLVKLFAIMLVLMGHCIQQFDSGYVASPVFLFIYAFHMPLFMMLSGFFLDYDRILASPWRFTKKRFLQLILPSLFWLTVFWIVEICIGKSHESLVRTVWSGLWFLKSLFACNLLLLVSLIIFKNRVLAVVVALIVSQITLFVHTNGFLNLHTMFPCLIAGGLAKRYLYDSSKYRTWFVVVLSAIVFMILYHSFGPDEMYLKLSLVDTRQALTSYGKIVLYKVVLGITGGTAVIGLFKIAFEHIDSSACKNPYICNLARLGQFTLEIYILQTVVLEIVMSHFLRSLAIPDAITYYVFPAVVLIICVGLIEAFKRCKIDYLFNFNKLK